MQVSTYHPLEKEGENSDSGPDSPYINARILQEQRPPTLSETQRQAGIQASHLARTAKAKALQTDEEHRRRLIAHRHALLRKLPIWNERAVEDARRKAAEEAGITLPHGSTPLEPKTMTEWLKRLKVNIRAYEAWAGGAVETFYHSNPDWSLRDWLSLVLEYRDWIPAFAHYQEAPHAS